MSRTYLDRYCVDASQISEYWYILDRKTDTWLDHYGTPICFEKRDEAEAYAAKRNSKGFRGWKNDRRTNDGN